MSLVPKQGLREQRVKLTVSEDERVSSPRQDEKLREHVLLAPPPTVYSVRKYTGMHNLCM